MASRGVAGNACAASLAGRCAVVTGASRGIGRSIALTFSGAGAGVAVVARSREGLEAAAAEIGVGGGRVVPVVCDVTDPRQVERMARDVLDTLGGLDILVNSAGEAGSHRVLGHPDELWFRMLATNLTSVYLVTKAFLAALIERGGGRVINVASTAAKTGTPYTAAYTAAKHGVLGLTRVLAAELAAYHVTVNAICPGFVDTSMTERSIANIVARTGKTEREARDALIRTNPQGRFVEPAEVAAVALFLAGEHSGSITGQAINVDGGAVPW